MKSFFNETLNILFRKFSEGMICFYIFLYHSCGILKISLVIFWFFTRAVTAFTLWTWARCYSVIGLKLYVTASSCQCGTNEPSGCGFQAHSVGSGILASISLSFQKYPARIHARFICWRIPDGDGTSILRFTLGVEIRGSVRPILKGTYFVKPYAFGGISKQSSNVTMSPVPDPRSSLVPFKLHSKYRSIITLHLLNKEEMSMISL